MISCSHCMVMSWDVMCTCQQKSSDHSQLFLSRMTMKNDCTRFLVFRQCFNSRGHFRADQFHSNFPSRTVLVSHIYVPADSIVIIQHDLLENTFLYSPNPVIFSQLLTSLSVQFSITSQLN